MSDKEESEFSDKDMKQAKSIILSGLKKKKLIKYNPIQMATDIVALIEYIDFLHSKDPLGHNLYIGKFHDFFIIKKRYN